MAKKLNQFRRKEVRCIIYTDKNGSVNKVTDEKSIQDIIKNENKENYTIIYNPTDKQRDEIIRLSKNKKNEASKEEVLMITGDDFISKMLIGLTDIEVDLNNKEELKALESFMNGEGGEEFALIFGELNMIYANMWKIYISQTNAIYEINEGLALINETTNSLKNKGAVEKINKAKKTKKVNKK